MSKFTRNQEWLELWDERGRSVKQILGDTIPPGEVVPFSWEQFILPGACGLSFKPSEGHPQYTYMTLGITQPIRQGDVVPNWEFAVKAKDYAKWPHHILYDLLTYWLDQKPNIRRGHYLPLVYFLDDDNQLCAGLSDNIDNIRAIGDIRGLYLWSDLGRLNFKVSSGDFGLMVAVAVTEDEIQLARSTSPPHLLLLLKQMHVAQISDPLRKSVITLPGALAEWERIRTLSHRQVVSEIDCEA